MPHFEIILFFIIIAFVYASVGFGGGSSYLAILSMYELPFREIRLIALICNIVVVTSGTIIFLLNREINWKKILPLALLSIPMAYLGGSLPLKEEFYFLVLGITLLVASVLLWIKPNNNNEWGDMKTNYVRDGLLGGGIGFLSGMVGIGGGIFLSPLLNLMGWDTSRKIAAAASVFILVNSISGIAGQLRTPPASINYSFVAILAGAVLIGGFAGSKIAVLKFNHQVVRRLTACLVFIAGIEVLYKHLNIF
jgi:uncharacterized membrane protein YfcA